MSAESVISVMRREGVGLRPSEIAAIGFVPLRDVRAALERLRRKGVVTRNSNGYWELQDNAEGSQQ